MIQYEFEARCVMSVDTACNFPVHVDLSYDKNDPYAVTATFTAGSEPTKPWVFARDLLVTAANKGRIVGRGDVRFRTVEPQNQLYMYLESPEGRATVLFDLDLIRGFLADTAEEAALPSQAVGNAIDAFLAEVLG